MKSLIAIAAASTLLAACSTTTMPWTFRDAETGRTTTTNVREGIVRADIKRQVVDACIESLDKINEEASKPYLVGKAPGGYEWYATNPNARVYGPQDCQGLMITGMDIANNAMLEVRGILGGLVNALPWVAMYKLGKAGINAAGDSVRARGDVEYNVDTIRDTYGSDVASGSTVDRSASLTGDGSLIEFLPGAPSQSSSTNTTTTTYPPVTEIETELGE